MLCGFNHNIRYRDRLFHVQTEDHGLKQATVVTQVFLDGHVVHHERTSYQALLQHDGVHDPEQVREHMQTQHKQQLRRLVSGEFDARIEQSIQKPSKAGTPPPHVTAAPTLMVEPTDQRRSAFLEALDQEMARQAPPELPSVRSARKTRSLAFAESRLQNRNKGRRVPPATDTLIDFGIPGSLREVLRAQNRPPSPVSGPLPAGVAPVRPRDGSPLPKTDTPRPPSPGTPSTAARRPPESYDESGPQQTILEVDAAALRREIEAQRDQLRALRREASEAASARRRQRGTDASRDEGPASDQS